MTPETAAKVRAARDMIAALCKRRDEAGKREWIMSIPAQPDHDPDLVIAAALDAQAAEIERAEARIVELIPIWNEIEQTRATIESTARLAGEAGHTEMQKTLRRWHEDLSMALEAPGRPHAAELAHAARTICTAAGIDPAANWRRLLDQALEHERHYPVAAVPATAN